MKDTLKYELETDFDLEFNDLIVTEESNDISSTLKNSVTGGTVTKAGIDKQNLQDAIDAYAIELNKAAIARSTGMPVKTPSAQYKGFAAEEFFKRTLEINALAKGKKLQVFTKGPLPDGSTLSCTDMTTDISIWYKKHLLSKPKKLADYQSKIHNNSSDYAKDISNKQYKNVNFVGGANQGVNDKVIVNIGKREYSSDSITPEEATKLADAMKSQNAPTYGKASEKHAELDKVNLGKAVKTGAVTGLITSFTKEIISVFKNRNNLNKEQFINAIKNIIYGTTDGGVRNGSIMGSVHLLSKMAGKEITSNSLGAIPAMTTANVGVDLAKDLYHCFVSQDIDADDLLCNTINNVYNSFAGFGGTYVGGQLAIFSSAKIAAANGAAIGSTLGPVGTIIGSVIGSFIVGMGANAVVDVANKDAQLAFASAVRAINSNIETNSIEHLYYFADEISTLSEFRLSFKSLLPCYNLISDMKEYALRKKAIKNISCQIEDALSSARSAEDEEINQLIKFHQDRIEELQVKFKEQNQVMFSDLSESLNSYISYSYGQYLNLASVNNIKIEDLFTKIDDNSIFHNDLLEQLNYRTEVNLQLNETLRELVLNSDNEKTLRPLIEKIQWFMNQDELLISKQYISLEEAIDLIGGKI